MRKKEDKPKATTPTQEFGVADGLDFGTEVNETEIEEKVLSPTSKKKKKVAIDAEIDPSRNYNKYYTPKPKIGSKGGTLGRGSVDEKQRKVQFSLTCTKDQKERFTEASQKEHRKLPEFICLAVEEYIKNHNL